MADNPEAAVPERSCMLAARNCPIPRYCARCGWYPEEAERRKRRIRAGLLIPNKDGLARLILWKKGDDR